MTKTEALEKAATEWWKSATADEITRFQLYESKLCMPFGEFHAAVEKALGRSVWTHEFAQPKSLQLEFEGRVDAPSVAEIFAQIPVEKRIIVEAP